MAKELTKQKKVTKELVHKYRPKTLEEVCGQEDAVRTIKGHIKSGKLPHAFLFYGPPGVGKTTMARILATEHIGCDPSYLKELNIADLTSIDTVRDIIGKTDLRPMVGKNKIWILDEVQGMGKPAQQAFLKLLEEPPSHVYFILSTTDPDKLVNAIRSRCMKVKLSPIADKQMEALLKGICEKEGLKISGDVIDKIVSTAMGSARDAVKYLDQIKGIKHEEDQLKAILTVTEEANVIELARKLMDSRTRWVDIKGVLKKLEGEEPEMIRRIVLGYITTVVVNGGNPKRCKQIYDEFRDEMYQTGRAGFSQLVFATLSVIGLR